MSLLCPIDLLLDELDHNVVINQLVGRLAVGDTLSIVSLASFFASQSFRNGNVAPLEVICDSHSHFALAAAGGSSHEDTAGLWVAERLGNEVEWVVGLADDEISQEVLEKFVNLVGF